MAFFENIARSIVNFFSTVWGFMKTIAAAILNNTFGAFTGNELSPEVAGIVLWGGLGGVIIIVLVTMKGFSFKGR